MLCYSVFTSYVYHGQNLQTWRVNSKFQYLLNNTSSVLGMTCPVVLETNCQILSPYFIKIPTSKMERAVTKIEWSNRARIHIMKYRQILLSHFVLSTCANISCLFVQYIGSDLIIIVDFMIKANINVFQVFSGESADSGHGTLDSNEFSGQTDLSDDEMKVNQFIPSFSLLPSQ